MAYFRKKPKVIEARRFQTNNDDGSHIRSLLAWINSGLEKFATSDMTYIYIGTLEGRMTADVGDWIICGVAGEFYPCKPDIFAESYEPVEETEAAASEPRGTR